MTLARPRPDLTDGLPAAGWITRFVGLDVTDSTNRRLKEDDYPPGTLLYTLDQRQGRGRLGRTWQAPPGSSLAFSVLLPERLDDTARPLLPLAAALAVCEGLDRLCPGGEFAVKWPNDIVCGGRKVCGILCEHTVDGANSRTVCGVGLNLRQTAADFAAAGLPYAGSLAMAGWDPEPDAVLTALAAALCARWEELARQGPAPLLRDLAPRCLTLHRPVRVLADPPFTGQAVGLSPDGGLVVDTPAGRRTVTAGEVSVRGLYGYLPNEGTQKG